MLAIYNSDGDIELIAQEAHETMRLDLVLAQNCGEISRARIQSLIRAGHVRADDKIIREADYRVNAGAKLTVTIPPAESSTIPGEKLPLDVRYEDEDLLIINKPAGLVTHPARGHESGTLVNALIAHCGESLSGIGGVQRPGIVHRLDKGTSGLLVVAKSDRSHLGLAAQFADHGRTGKLERAYLALVWGSPVTPSGIVDAPLSRASGNRRKIRIQPNQGRFARTSWRRKDIFYDPNGKTVAAEMDCRLETGRTHQIRVHMTSINHPVIGDTDYGAGFSSRAARLALDAQEAVLALRRPALHAYLLAFTHPVSGRFMRFLADPPEDISQLRRLLQAKSCA